MASAAKIIVATGVSSGLGFEAMKQLLATPQPYRILLGARDVSGAQSSFEKVAHGSDSDQLTVFPLQLADLASVKKFAQQVLAQLGSSEIDYLLLNAGMVKAAHGEGLHGSKWCEAAVVNHFSQHYLIHLLRDKLVASKSRIVVVSSGAIRNVSDTTALREDLRAGSGVDAGKIYSESKFLQLLAAHWWRRHLAGQCHVVAVSPGLVPNTGISRDSALTLTMDMPDAKTVPEGAQSILAAFSRSDFPQDPDRIFLTSWGEWWERGVIEKSLDRELQDAWCPSKDELEIEFGSASAN